MSSDSIVTRTAFETFTNNGPPSSQATFMILFPGACIFDATIQPSSITNAIRILRNVVLGLIRTSDLNTAVDQAKDLGYPWVYGVFEYLMNKGHVWAHELMHIEWATNSGGYGPNKRPRDLTLVFANIKGVFKAYGPLVTLRNADSLALYALVWYIQSKIGNIYPHLPLALAPPESAYEGSNKANELPDSRAMFKSWGLESDGSIVPPALSKSDVDHAKCPESFSPSVMFGPNGDDAYDKYDEGDSVAQVNKFLRSKDDFPPDYLNQLTKWYNELYN
ncbi:unnamed protein product [Fusarium graminearum]|uniref:Chromosome 3, complete genome n=1 Tax=Gibberella zeae (strain ATCC MYA-4620 / CBS 123657 / FGSC 9075 / NRRL 31084 / PH-1) TaxID=229533 RepID=A0A098DY66_GIBZE|nr:unnamed protein product [Fusarium graminearum]CEF86294.1 unnamed protein product [Fusarium graminearum]